MRILLSLFVMMVIVVPGVFADRGSIPYQPDVKIFEPNQRAMIAWNGKREILVLSTDLYTSKPTKVLEVIPFPSEPSVKKGDVEVFKKATDIINRKMRPKFLSDGSLSRGMGEDGVRGAVPAGEVTFHEKIGAHDVSVAHVLDATGFVKWVQDYLKAAAVENPVIPAPLKEAIEEYLKEDFTWFVFDVVELDQNIKTNDAIQYTFDSKFLYYPLKISRTDTGFTTIDLLVLSPELLDYFPGIPSQEVELPHSPVPLTDEELLSLNQDMHTLLKPEGKDMELRIWKISGDLAEFKADLLAGTEKK